MSQSRETTLLDLSDEILEKIVYHACVSNLGAGNRLASASRRLRRAVAKSGGLTYVVQDLSSIDNLPTVLDSWIGWTSTFGQSIKYLQIDFPWHHSNLSSAIEAYMPQLETLVVECTHQCNPQDENAACVFKCPPKLKSLEYLHCYGPTELHVTDTLETLSVGCKHFSRDVLLDWDDWSWTLRLHGSANGLKWACGPTSMFTKCKVKLPALQRMQAYGQHCYAHWHWPLADDTPYRCTLEAADYPNLEEFTFFSIYCNGRSSHDGISTIILFRNGIMPKLKKFQVFGPTALEPHVIINPGTLPCMPNVETIEFRMCHPNLGPTALHGITQLQHLRTLYLQDVEPDDDEYITFAPILPPNLEVADLYFANCSDDFGQLNPPLHTLVFPQRPPDDGVTMPWRTLKHLVINLDCLDSLGLHQPVEVDGLTITIWCGINLDDGSDTGEWLQICLRPLAHIRGLKKLVFLSSSNSPFRRNWVKLMALSVLKAPAHSIDFVFDTVSAMELPVNYYLRGGVLNACGVVTLP